MSKNGIRKKGMSTMRKLTAIFFEPGDGFESGRLRHQRI